MLVSTVSALAQSPGTPSPGWALVMPRGPDVRVKITEGHAKLVARDVYFWAWPMVNIYNRRLAFRNSVTFAKDQTPPVSGFWSLTLYNEHHFFAPNELKRYSLGTKNKTLKYNPDGSLTIYVQADPPPETQRANWLPAPKDADFSLYMRAYWPKTAIVDGSWTPPAAQKSN
jgi:hypothetical protein